MRMNKRPVYLTLLRHTEYDPQSGNLTSDGHYCLDLVANHLHKLTNEDLLPPDSDTIPTPAIQEPGGSRIADLLYHRSSRLHDPYARPIDAIASSDAPRTLESKALLASLLKERQHPNHKKPILELGEFDWLRESAYPDSYNHFSFYNAFAKFDYDHFTAAQQWFQQAAERELKHVVLVTHFPALRALSLAMVAKKATPSAATADDVEIDKLEHKLQKKRFGATVTFCAKNWQSMLGHAAPIGVPFIPDPANNCVSPMPPDIWRGIKDRINQMAK